MARSTYEPRMNSCKLFMRGDMFSVFVGILGFLSSNTMGDLIFSNFLDPDAWDPGFLGISIQFDCRSSICQEFVDILSISRSITIGFHDLSIFSDNFSISRMIWTGFGNLSLFSRISCSIVKDSCEFVWWQHNYVNISKDSCDLACESWRSVQFCDYLCDSIEIIAENRDNRGEYVWLCDYSWRIVRLCHECHDSSEESQ